MVKRSGTTGPSFKTEKAPAGAPGAKKNTDRCFRPGGAKSCVVAGFRWFRFAAPPANVSDASGVDVRQI